MELVLFGVALTAMHIVGLCALFILFCVSASWDRRGRTSFKWLLLLGSMVGLAVLFRPAFEFSFEAIKNLLLSPALWIPILSYSAAGLVYAGVEFFLTVRKAVRATKESWLSYLKSRQSTLVAGGTVTKTIEEWIVSAKSETATQQDISTAKEAVEAFTRRNDYDFIGFEANELNIEPKMDRWMLSQFIGAWVVFWPFYLVSLILGDLLSEIFQTISDFVAEHCGRFVRRAFSDVFKVS